ncbi:hypothetical protein TWF694_011712 [Orbilia ellipsospora]|uniref:Uncharacterized protein n=1 Tax=Orbilia ellipsospora TaxID=2528407 RepID=A0AAV9X601_9PEZI
MTAASGMAPLTTNTHISEDDERISLEKLVKLRDAVKAGQHPKYKPKPPVSAVAATTTKASNANPNKNTNGNLANNTIDTTARPIPVFTGSMPKGEQNGGRAVITVAGKDAPNQNNQNNTRNDRQQPQQQQQQGQRPLLSPRNQQPQQQQWDQSQTWSVPQMQPQVHANQEDINAFAQHLSMLPVPPPGFELPHGFPPFVPPPPPLPIHGQALTTGQPLPQLMQMTNQSPPQLDPMAVDNPIKDPRSFDHKDHDMIGNIQQRQAEIIQSLQSSSGTADLQASLKKAQEYAATLPPKPVGAPKPSAPITSNNNNNSNNKQQPEKNRNAAGLSSSPQATTAFPDRRDDGKQDYQRQQPRDHRQYHDKRSGEPPRKPTMNSGKEDRREREREQPRQFERERDRDRWAGGVDNRNYNNKKRKSSSPNYDDLPSKALNFAAPQPIRPADALIRSHEHHKVIDVDETDDDQKKRANTAKDAPKTQQSAEKKVSPAPPPVKREAPPPSPVVTIPRGSPTLEPLSPGRARAYGVPPPLPQERYSKQTGYFRYREQFPPPPAMGYARSPYDPDYGYPPPPSHAREPRPLSPRRVYVGPEGRGYAQEYVYQDPYHDPYNPYHSRRPGSPLPPPRAAAPRYRYEEEDRVPRGRSPSPRVTNRMPAVRPRRSSRSLSPSRERPLPRASAPPAEPAEEPRSERSLIRASDAPHFADYPPAYHHRSMIPYDAYGDPYRPVVIRERVPVYITRVVYVDSNDPEGRPYRPRSPGYPPPHHGPPPPLAHPHHPPPPHLAPAAPAHPAQPPPPPPMRRYVDDPDVVMSDRMYRERDYDYGPYDRGYAREYTREYPPPPPAHHHAHHHPPPLPVARDAYGREYAMQPTTAREDERERHFREREREYPSPGLGGQPPPPHPAAAARDVDDGRLPYARDGRGMAPPPGGVRYS